MVKRALVATFCFAAVLSACSEKSATAPSTALVVSLASPNSDDGALILIVRGPELGRVQSMAPPATLYTRVTSQTEARVLIVGDIVPGDLLRVELTGAHAISEYSATVSQVATRTDSLRASTEGYVLHLREERQ